MNISLLLSTPAFWVTTTILAFFSWLAMVVIKSPPHADDQKNRGYHILFGVIILVFGFILILSSQKDSILWSVSNHDGLMVTQGKITQSRTQLEGSASHNALGLHFEIWYEYKVDERLYASNRVRYGSTGSSDEYFATNYINKYPVGKVVTVYYDLHDPQKSVLEPDVIDYEGILALIMIATFGVFFITIGIVPKQRPTKRAPDAGDSAAISSSFLRLVIFLVGRLRRPQPQRR